MDYTARVGTGVMCGFAQRMAKAVAASGEGDCVITFEIRLKEERPAASLLFVTARSSDVEAVEQARRLLERHPEYDTAEIWNGMKMIRQI